MIDVKEFKAGEDFSELRTLVGEYSFVVFGLQAVRAKIWYSASPRGDDHYCYTLSHFFGPNRQQGPHLPDAAFAQSEEAALRKAMSTFVTLFPPEEEAQVPVSSGAWLVENKYF